MLIYFRVFSVTKMTYMEIQQNHCKLFERKFLIICHFSSMNSPLHYQFSAEIRFFSITLIFALISGQSVAPSRLEASGG